MSGHLKRTSHVCRLKSGRKQKTGTFLKELTQPLGKLLAAGYSVEVRIQLPHNLYGLVLGIFCCYGS